MTCYKTDSKRYLRTPDSGPVIDEIVLQSKIEFNYDEE